MAEKTPIDEGMIQQATGTVQVSGVDDAYFSPLEPLKPQVPNSQIASVRGRAFDYPTGYNTRTKPKSDSPITFEQLRFLSDNYDILRLAIQTRKDQICALNWSVTPKDTSKEADDRCLEVEEFFTLPDGENTWNTWIRQVIEDHLVLDAVAIYPWMRKNGKPYRFEVVDGATIKRIIDGRGRTPASPSPAYQQILKGIPAINYTADELIYRIWNKRSNQIYGLSNVEQVIMTVNTGIRKSLSQLERFTSGSVPDLIFTAPPDWQMEQISVFNDWWQSKLSGNTASQRMAQFVPHGVVPIDTKQAVLKDEYDEWLVRIICYCFSLSPSAFVRSMNRATAENASDMAKQEGLFPMMAFTQELMNLMIQQYFGYKDLQFKWNTENETAPLDQATLDDMALKNGSKTLNQIRQMRGDDPYPSDIGDLPMVLTASGYVPITPNPPTVTSQTQNESPTQSDDQSASQEPSMKPEPIKAKKLEKFKASQSEIKKAKSALEDDGELDSLVNEVAAYFTEELRSSIAKIVGEISEGESIDEIEINFGDLAPKIFDYLVQAGKLGIAKGGAEIKEAGEIVEAEAEVVAEKSLMDWAMERVGNLIGMTQDEDGNWIPNPNPEFSISDSTREMIKADVQRAIEEGMSNEELSDLLESSYTFSQERAEVIARTETANAAGAGTLASYKANSVPYKQWVTAPDCCDDCLEIDGETVPVDEDFSTGDDTYPLHPNCRCTVVAVFEKPDDEESSDDSSEES